MTALEIAPEVAAFLAAVRERLTDLDPEDQREILDGLEADLSDLVSDRGPDALGDPAAYAAELRQAAGIAPSTSSAAGRRSPGATVTAVLDAAHQRADALVAAVPGNLSGVLGWFRPLWWVLRGWVAAQALDAAGGVYQAALLPEIGDLGVLPLAALVLLSVLLGAGKVWRGDPRNPAYRLTLLALNAAALVGVVVAVPAVVDHAAQRYDRGFARGFTQGVDADVSNEGDGAKAGLYRDGIWVSNIYPYDAQGRPLAGVQLFDQTGKPLNVITQPEYGSPELAEDGSVLAGSAQVDPATGEELPRIFYPWTNGAAQLYNVFPLPSRVQHGEELSPTAFSEKDKPAVGPFPLASVPAASLPGIATGVQKEAR